MPRWKKHVKEFEVDVSGDEIKGSKIIIPKPIMDMWYRPSKVKFVIGRNNKVCIEPVRPAS